MAYSFAVAEKRTGRSIKFSSKGDRVDVGWQNEYQVTVSATGGDAVEDVSPYDVATATGLPSVNKSIYYFGGKVLPFVICRDKQATPRDGSHKLWDVRCDFRSFDGARSEQAPVSPPATIASLGTSEQAELGEFEKVLYQDKSSTPKAIRLPSGAFFSEPVLERIPTLTIKLTQYESSITYEQMLDRKFKVNDATYRSQAAGKWLIEHVEASEVTVQLSGGASNVALVTYTIRYSPLSEGWKRALALYDYKYKSGSVFKWNLEGDMQAATLTRVQTDGTKKTTGVVPDYEEFQVYDDIDFSSFLQA